MDLPIQTIPILEGKVAERFLETARVNESEKAGSVDFSNQFLALNAMLKKACRN